MEEGLSFNRLGKQGVIQCWYYDEGIEVLIKIDKTKITSTVDRSDFYYRFIELLEILNIDAFRLVLYARDGEEFNKIVTLRSIKDKVDIAVNEGKRELLNIVNISKLLN